MRLKVEIIFGILLVLLIIASLANNFGHGRW